MGRHLKPLNVDPGELSRRALMRAAQAVAEGRRLEPVRLAQAAGKVAELEAFLPRGDWYEVPEDEDLDGRTEHMRLMVRCRLSPRRRGSKRRQRPFRRVVILLDLSLGPRLRGNDRRMGLTPCCALLCAML